MQKLIIALLLIASFSNGFAAETESLVIRSADKQHLFSVEVVSTPQARADGLMYRTSLPADGGMLFNFGKTEPVSMWMKNTAIPLDMLFIRADGTITNIAERTVPQSLTPVAASEPVPFVLEINGGVSARLGIRAGDKAQHPLFGTKNE